MIFVPFVVKNIQFLIPMNVSNIKNRKYQKLDAAYHSAIRDDILVLIGHGVTGNKDRPLLVGIATELAQRGIPSIRFSFSGNGNSEGPFENATIINETEDLVDILDQLPKDITIVYAGHSMGGAVGVLTANQEPDRIQFLVSLAGMVDTAGFFQREFGEVTPGNGLMWDKPECPYSQAHHDVAKSVNSTLPQAAKVTQPWLLIHGVEDDLVPLSDSQAAAKAATTKVKLLEIPNEDHLFSEAVYPTIAAAIVDWVK